MELAKCQYVAEGLDVLATIRQFVEKTAKIVCKDPDAVSELVIGLNEAVTNVIVHGYKGQPGLIEIAVESSERRLSVRIRDLAPFFDPTSVASPDVTLPLDERSYGGMGVHMMRAFVDNLVYRAIPSGGNELILEKVIAK